MNTHDDLRIAIETERAMVKRRAAARQRNFDRYTRRYERHHPPSPNRAARRAQLQAVEAPFAVAPKKQASMIERLKDLFFPRLPAHRVKAKTQYQPVLVDNRVLLREIRNVDRRVLREIRRSKRHQPPSEKLP